MIRPLLRLLLFLTAKPLRRAAVFLSYGAGVLISALPVFYAQAGGLGHLPWWPTFLPGDLASLTWLLLVCGFLGIALEVREQQRLRQENQRLRGLLEADARRVQADLAESAQVIDRERRRRRFAGRFLRFHGRRLLQQLVKGEALCGFRRVTLLVPLLGEDGKPHAFQALYSESNNPLYSRQRIDRNRDLPKRLLLTAWQHGWIWDDDLPPSETPAYRETLRARYGFGPASGRDHMQPRLYACLRIHNPLSTRCVALLVLESTDPAKRSQTHLRRLLQQTARHIAWLPALWLEEHHPAPN